MHWKVRNSREDKQLVMHHIVYLSSVAGHLNEQELRAILLKSREKNTRRGITGMLLLCNDNIMQVLEGEQDEITALYQLIERDFRHTRIFKLADGKITERAFPDWSMGFTTASPQEFNRLIGYFNPQDPDFVASYAAQGENEILDLVKEFCMEKQNFR